MPAYLPSDDPPPVAAEENAATSARFGVRAMPTVLAFCDGEVRGQLVGARRKADFEDLIGRILEPA